MSIATNEAYKRELGYNDIYMSAIAAVYKSLTGSDIQKHLQMRDTILNNPKEFLNGIIHSFGISDKIDYNQLIKIQSESQQIAQKITRIDESELTSFNTQQMFDENTNIGNSITQIFDCAYETASEIEDPDIGKEELKNNVVIGINNTDTPKLLIGKSEFQRLFVIIFAVVVQIGMYLLEQGGFENISVIGLISHLLRFFIDSLSGSMLFDSK